MHEEIIADPARDWGLGDLAELVYLSPKQTGRVFADAFGKTPLAFQTMLRVQEMARLLRETDSTIASAAEQVGWRSRNRATEAFQTYAGLTPHKYRQLWQAGHRIPANGTSRS